MGFNFGVAGALRFGFTGISLNFLNVPSEDFVFTFLFASPKLTFLSESTFIEISIFSFSFLLSLGNFIFEKIFVLASFKDDFPPKSISFISDKLSKDKSFEELFGD